MENFNKNWLLILLVAIVFGTLGYLLGKTSNGRHMVKDQKEHRVMKFHGDDGNDFVFEVEGDDDGFEVIEKVDTVMKDGKRIITKEVKKTKKN